MNKKVFAAMMTAVMAVSGIGGSVSVAAEEKQDLVLMIESTESGNAEVLEMVKEKFGDKYNLIFKTYGESTEIIQSVKTAALAGEQLDLCFYWPNSMIHFVEDDFAMPLDEYVQGEWAERFSEGALEIGTLNEHLYNLPYATVYPMVVVNKTLADEAGVELSEDGQWTWEEFLDFSNKVKETTEADGSVIASDWATWLTRNSIMQIWETSEELEAFCAGEVSLESDEIKEASELVNSAFTSDVFYPGGEASLAVEKDEAYAAFASGKTASIFIVNSEVVNMLNDTGIEEYVIMDWPVMGPNEQIPVLGGCSGYFVPNCAKNVDGALEVLDFLTGEECATVRAEAGLVSTIRVSEDAEVDEALMPLISRCSDQIHKEICDVNTSVSNYINASMPANYYFYGEESLKELEELRLEGVE